LENEMSAEHIAACLRHEADNPGAMYVNDEWGYPSCIGSVLIYKQFPWRPMTQPKLTSVDVFASYAQERNSWMVSAPQYTQPNLRLTFDGKTLVAADLLPNAKSEPTAPLLAQVGSTDGLAAEDK
jgi:hypothetical protein